MPSFEERFWSSVEKTEGCWLWTGFHGGRYGQIGKGGSRFYAHRVSYELNVGPIPPGLVIDHLCRVRHCVNPAHLQAVPQRVNVLRSEDNPIAKQARQTHCKRGHPLSGDNLRVDKKGKRRCITCLALTDHARYWAGRS